ncbi:MAG: cadherin-like domain-containing protein [Colwellia sp.]|nr:cadherin-like domain-containing protein [Colwellia sp.]
MKKYPFIIGLLSPLFINQAYAENHQLDFASNNWSLIKTIKLQQTAQEISTLTSRANKGKSFNLNIELLEQVLGNQETITIDLPLPNGQFSTFKLTTSSVMNSELAAKYPSIKTFTGYQVDKPEHKGHFDITPHGFHGVFTFDNDKVYIDPIKRGNRLTYHSYFRKDAEPLSLIALGKRFAPRKHLSLINNEIASDNRMLKQQNKAAEIITYRIAVSTTAEYSTFHGGTKEGSLAAIVTMLNRVNEVFERDLSIKLELIANNESIIFTDAETDPFTNTDGDIDLNTDVINTAVGADNYDIGHVVGTGGGGVAGLGVVCSDYKAEGLTGSDSPTNDSFYIDYVAHEIGHQFGAEHTFNGSLGACDGNREASSAYEPGSASTIMGYAGICGEQNLQNSSDPYFHLHSIEQITSFTQNGNGNSCGAKVAQTNQAPTVNAGSDFTIPARTPFTLIGQGTDNENDSLTYSWEQYDLGTMSSSKDDDKTDDGTRPLFRAFAPNSSNERTFPVLSDILLAKQTHGEALPTTTRDLNFRLVVRDNQGNVSDDAMKVSVIANVEGFSLIEPSIGASWLGEQQTVTWNTASTEQAPVSCNTVNILLSTDSGNTFSQVLVNETPNDGSQIVNFSSINTETARIKIICNDNIFFAINTADISINSDGVYVDTKPVFSSQNVLNINEDNTLTLNKSDLVFNNNLVIDSIAIVAGDNYQVEGLKIIPEENFNGELLIKTIATQGQLSSDEFTVKVMVIAVNDVPVALDDSVSFVEDSVNNSIDVLANDTDIENDTLAIKTINYSGLGNAVIENNNIIYTPQASFSGIETITYVVNDGLNDSASATLTITVTAKVVVEPEPEPVPVPEAKKSSGGAAIYLLVLLLTAARRFKGGK